MADVTFKWCKAEGRRVAREGISLAGVLSTIRDQAKKRAFLKAVAEETVRMKKERRSVQALL